MPLRLEVFTEKEGWITMADLSRVVDENGGYSKFVRNGRGDVWNFKKGESNSETIIEHLVFQLVDFDKNSLVSTEEIVLKEGESYEMELSRANILKHRVTQVSAKL